MKNLLHYNLRYDIIYGINKGSIAYCGDGLSPIQKGKLFKKVLDKTHLM
jgi:hypothetical protein